MHGKKLFGTTTVGTKGQLVIPVSAREEMGVNVGDRMYAVGSPHQGMIILLQESKLENFIEHMNLQIETFQTLKKEKEKEDQK